MGQICFPRAHYEVVVTLNRRCSLNLRLKGWEITSHFHFYFRAKETVMDTSALLRALLLCPTLFTDRGHMFNGELYTGASVKLITSQKSNFAPDTVSAKIFQSVLQIQAAKLIISEPSILTDIPSRFQVQNHLRNHSGLQIPSSAGCLRFTVKTELAFVFLNDCRPPEIQDDCSWDSRMQVNANFKGFQIRAHIQFPFNLNPNQVRYVFIGDLVNMQIVFALYKAQVLKFKWGIVSSNDNLLAESLLLEQPVPFTRNVRFQLFPLESAVSVCDVNMKFLWNRHIVTDSYPTKVHRITNPKGVHVGGVTYKFLESIAKRNNFSFDYRFEGYRLKQEPNGSWTGFLGDMIDGRADMVMMPVPSLGRFPWCDLTNPIFLLKFGLLTPLPSAGVEWTAIFLVFNVDVWVGIAVTFALSMLIFHTAFKADVIFRERPYSRSSFEVFAAVLMILLRTEAPSLPKTARIFSAAFLAFSMYVGMFFDSNLTSFLTLPRIHPIPSTLKDLAQAPDYSVDFVHYVGATGTIYLEENADPLIRSVVSRMNYIPPLQSSEAVTNLVLQGKTVLIDYQELSMVSVAEKLTLYPGLYPVNIAKPIIGFHTSVGLRRYSKYFEEVNTNVGRLGDTGHYQKWNQEALELARKYGRLSLKQSLAQNLPNVTQFYQKLVHATEKLIMGSSFKPFTLENFLFSFIALTCGTVGAFTAFTAELILTGLRRFWRQRCCRASASNTTLVATAKNSSEQNLRCERKNSFECWTAEKRRLSYMWIPGGMT